MLKGAQEAAAAVVAAVAVEADDGNEDDDEDVPDIEGMLCTAHLLLLLVLECLRGTPHTVSLEFNYSEAAVADNDKVCLHCARDSLVLLFLHHVKHTLYLVVPFLSLDLSPSRVFPIMDPLFTVAIFHLSSGCATRGAGCGRV